MSSLRCLSGGALLGLLALWSGCGGVADPGPLTGYDDGDGGSLTSGGSAGSRTDDPEPIATGGNGPNSANECSAGSECVDPELGIDGNGGRSGSAGNGGGGGTGPVGVGGTPPTGTGGTEPGTGGTDPGTGGTESGSGGTFDPGTGGTESGSGGTEPATGGTGGDENGGAGGEIAQGGQGSSDEPPPIVDVEVGQCEAFEPCGGDVEGVWTYTAACVDLDDLGLSAQAIEDMCPGAQLTLSGQVSGTLTFEDGFVTRQGQSRAEGEVFVPALCAVALGGCNGVEDDLAEAGLLGAVCLGQGSLFLPSCRCSFEIEAPEIELVSFVTVGDVLRLADGRDFAYCAVGDSLSYEEIGAATEPGVRELTRR